MCLLIIWIVLPGYGSQEIPRSAVCKRENQESWQRNFVRVQRSENQGVDGVSPSLGLKVGEPEASMSEGRRRWMFKLKQRGWIYSLSTFPSIQALSGLGDNTLQWWGSSTFVIQSIDSNAKFFQRHPHRHTQNNVLPRI